MRMILIRIQLTRRVSILHAPCQVANTPTASVGISIATTSAHCRQAVPNKPTASVGIR